MDWQAAITPYLEKLSVAEDALGGLSATSLDLSTQTLTAYVTSAAGRSAIEQLLAGMPGHVVISAAVQTSTQVAAAQAVILRQPSVGYVSSTPDGHVIVALSKTAAGDAQQQVLAAVPDAERANLQFIVDDASQYQRSTGRR